MMWSVSIRFEINTIRQYLMKSRSVCLRTMMNLKGPRATIEFDMDFKQT